MTTTRLLATAVVAALALGACGDDDDDADSTAVTPSAANTTAQTAPASEAGSGGGIYGGGGGSTTTAAATVEVADTSLGSVLASDGMTLYIFTPDEAGTPTCTGGCAGAWPPLLAEGDVSLGDALDTSLLGSAPHPDGGEQVTYGGWPLYFYAGDRAPGDVTGQGVGGNWFVIGADGEPIGM